ncbi:MerR family transcriptional regulator [Avibacterium paragallinarum]|uniref:DNA-binding protein n=1 Tax=Avibacterium paragallinarum TaxID=728 RepID=A0AAE5TKY8_AVIPA|nr:DNA-binding protein [Avibacterium paragallinarum]MEE3608233.1 DNA-binding protein [Avibacterium paragallinarum]MEE3621696.1 DNA-binding protein [Avibacterium paragallinarum]MEE3668382.1 DNA-binding protein [Avibacterium paragallinarum]MEE3680392.1 DNA-binding protein [Avibacterium paragallinarum]MEE4385949.1 DNA-binding protein [Avibacterium paragallinarum]
MEAKNSICINIQLHTAPYVTVKEYARLTGASVDKVRKMVIEGDLPIRPKKKLRDTVFINMVAIAKEASAQQ